MSRATTLHLPAREIPVPRSVSPTAQAFLASAARPIPPQPAPSDKAAWRDYIRESDQTILTMAAEIAKSAARQEMAAQIRSEPFSLGGVPGYRIDPHPNVPADRILYLIHGGALVMGAGEVCRLMATGTALAIGARTYAVDYRMPPDHPYPTPLEDCLAGYQFLLQHHDPAQIVVHGGSAGGNLAAAMVLRLRAAGAPMPAGIILSTPELDLTESGDSFAVNAGADIVLPPSLMNANLLYANGHDLADPYLSPLFADLSQGFPPTLLTAGTRDLFLSNAVRMHNALRRSGNHAELIIEEAMPHGGFFGMAPEDHALNADIRDFAERAWSGRLR